MTKIGHNRPGDAWKRKFQRLWQSAVPSARSKFIRSPMLPEMIKRATEWGVDDQTIVALIDGTDPDKQGEHMSDYVPRWALDNYFAAERQHAELH
jgi:hypothetical protein